MGPWVIETDRPSTEIETFLRRYAPWRMAVEFSSGHCSADFGRAEPWNAHPTHKAQQAMNHIPVADVRGQPILDVGFNTGHTALYMATEYGCLPTGIDVVRRHKEVADWLADALGVRGHRFLLADAQTYVEPEAFAAVFHFGTLYHLPNPLKSLECAVRSLRPGGWLALETTAYIGEPLLARFIHGFGGDKSNWWALGKGIIERYLSLLGMVGIRLVLEAHPPIFEGRMSRVLYVAQKAGV